MMSFLFRQEKEEEEGGERALPTTAREPKRRLDRRGKLDRRTNGQENDYKNGGGKERECDQEREGEEEETVIKERGEVEGGEEPLLWGHLLLKGMSKTMEVVVAPPPSSFDAGAEFLFAYEVWNGAVHMAEFILEHAIGSKLNHGRHRQSGFSVVNKSVLELGCAAGLPSMAALQAGARVVIASDTPSDRNVLVAARRNMKAVASGKSTPPEAFLENTRNERRKEDNDDTQSLPPSPSAQQRTLRPKYHDKRGAEETQQTGDTRRQQSTTRKNEERRRRRRKHGQGSGGWSVVAHGWGQDVTPLLKELVRLDDGQSERQDVEQEDEHQRKEERQYAATAVKVKAGPPLFDFVLASECLWLEKEHRNLLCSIDRCLCEHGIALISFCHHTRGKEEQDLAFFKLAEEEFNFDIEQLEGTKGPAELSSGACGGEDSEEKEEVNIYLYALRRRPTTP